MSDPKLGVGDVPITLGDREVVLKPSLHAIMTISRTTGGIVGAIQRVGNLDFETVALVVTLGLGMSGNSREVRELPEKIYQSGIMGLVPDVIRYLTILSNGGRPPPEEVAHDSENPPHQTGQLN